MSSNSTCVRLHDGQALVNSGTSSFRMARRDRACDDLGCPMQMVVGALGACIALTLDAVAKHKAIVLTNFEARLDYHTDGNDRTEFRVTLHLDPGLSDRERKILFQSAKLCEVGKVLKSDVNIDFRVAQPIPIR